jgi:hypothetical protein
MNVDAMPNPTIEEDLATVLELVERRQRCDVPVESADEAAEALDRIGVALGDKCEHCHGHGVFLDAFYTGEPPSCLRCDGVGFVTAKRRAAIEQTMHLEHMASMALRLGEACREKLRPHEVGLLERERARRQGSEGTK